MKNWSRHIWKIIGFSLFLFLPLFIGFYIIQTDQKQPSQIEQLKPTSNQEATSDNTQSETDKQKKAVEANSKPKESAENKQEVDKKEKDKKANEEKKKDVPNHVWGVDSASYTDETLLACVKENFGNPAVWGRYLGDKEGISKGITKAEREMLSKNGAKVLLISNQFTEAIGYDKGKAEAEEAIKLAKDVGAPEGIAIFADIEPDYPVDENFIVGWYETMSSSTYEPGIYGIFSGEEALTIAFNAAAEQKDGLKDEVYLWSAAPYVEITTEKNAPKYAPEGPKDSLLYGWQYGIDAETCNIDTNLFKGELLEHLW